MLSAATEKVLLTITIDTECDHDSEWKRSKPLTFHSINEGIPNRLQPVFNDVGAIPTYLLTVEVMEDAESVSTIRNIQGAHELGTHLHAAFIEPEKKFFDYAGIDSPDFQCNDKPQIEYSKLENLTNLFREKFGYSPVSFRAGRYGAGVNTIRSLTKLGYKVDTSVTPHIKWSEPRGDVDFRKAPEQPYYPRHDSLVDNEHQNRGPLLEMPVTMKKRWLRGPRWFRPWFSSVQQMKDIVQYHLKEYRNEKIININMMFHSMEIIAGATPYPQSENDVSRYLDDMHNILSWCKQEGIAFTSTKDFYSEFVV